MLDDITLYWLTETAASSTRIQLDESRRRRPSRRMQHLPHEIIRPPRG
jgi:hypothetical protein